MHITEIISIVFRLINFGALIALGLYFFKQYALDTIKLHISKRQQKVADLSLQNQLLKEQLKSIDFTIAEQQSVSRGLLQKIELWNTLVSQAITERLAEKEKRTIFLTHKSKRQQSYRELKELQKKALLPAIAKARTLLENKYSEQSLGQSFIHGIVHHLEKNKL